MVLFRKSLLPAVSALALLAGSALPAIADTVVLHAEQQLQQGRTWAHQHSDLTPDARMHYGQMPNGMRYVIMRNATPPGLAALRLHINAGSLHEEDDQKGLAHFTEHMLFNGTENIPENEMLRILERLGLAFGPDTNAGTSFDQTFYSLNLPRADDETLDASLNIMREQVSRALMNEADIEAERNVIVGEARTRDTPDFRNLRAQLALLAPGQRLADRLPIGDLAIIGTAPAQRFIDFYRAYYRPERATLIAVGDFDVDYMEAKIRAAFGDWTNSAPDGPEPDLGRPLPRQPDASILVEPGVQSVLNLFWIRDYEDKPDTIATRRENILRSLGFSVLNRRLGEISRQDNPPFLGAGGSQSDMLGSLSFGSVAASFNPGELAPALATIEQETRRLLEHGMTAVELQREITNGRTALQNAVNSANTQHTAGHAQNIMSSINEDMVITSPADSLARFETYVADIDPEEVRALLAQSFQGYGPMALINTPVPIEGGEAEVLRLLEASRQVPVSPRQAQAAIEWPYTDFGTPTVPSALPDFKLANATAYSFPNNVRLIVKPTSLRENQILVSVSTGIGDLGLSQDAFDPLRLAPSIFTAGGLGKLTVDELSRVMAGKTYSVGLTIGDDITTLSGATRPQDLDLQLQVMAAYFTDAALRDQPLQRVKSTYAHSLEQSRTTVGGTMSLEAPSYMAFGDIRAATPTDADLQAVSADQVRTALQNALKDGPLEITIVGDVTPDAAIAAVSKTFGALPTRTPLAAIPVGADQRHLQPATTEPVRFYHNGQPEQAGVALYYKGTDSFGDRREARLVSLLSEVLQLRVTEEIREKQALTYSPSASAASSNTYPDYGFITISGEVDTARIPDFYAAVDKVIASFNDQPVTADELNRARAPMIERHRRSQADNGFWLGNLGQLHRAPENEPLIVNYIETLQGFTAQDIQDAARTYLQSEKPLRVEVVPATR